MLGKEKNVNIQNDSPWIVMKFGGTSVSSAQCWTTICDQARLNLADGKRVMVVVSALSGTTNLLTRLTEGPGMEESGGIMSELRENHLQLYAALGLIPSAGFENHWDGLRDLLPAPGSVIATARICSPETHFGSHRAFCSSVPSSPI